jgi:SEC-C motif-containing protein
MRSRFVAFGLGNFDYIEKTQLDPLPAEVKERQAPEWERLEIVACENGEESDETGTVEFVAHYRMGERRAHHELSRFVKVNDEWRYQDGEITDQPLPENMRGKVGRNERCPCGSGKKFKRCCGV